MTAPRRPIRPTRLAVPDRDSAPTDDELALERLPFNGFAVRQWWANVQVSRDDPWIAHGSSEHRRCRQAKEIPGTISAKSDMGEELGLHKNNDDADASTGRQTIFSSMYPEPHACRS